MRIHRVKKGEETADIAKEYGIDERLLRKNNEIEDGERLSEGEELLILTPTRTYTAREGDCLSRVALRFGTPINELMRMNPHIADEKIEGGEIVAAKRDERPFGLGAANGVYYRGCPMWKLRRALPYTTYITVGSGIYDGDKCYESFSGGEVVDIALENGKMPLVRVYDKSGGKFCRSATERGRHIDELIYMALKGGYRGIVLSGGAICEGYEEFLVELRGRMIGLDLILVSEVDEASPVFVSDFSDGAIFAFDKCDVACCEDISFENQEMRIMEKFANEGESTKTFIELPVFAYIDRGGFLEIPDAIREARRQGAITDTDRCSMISAFKDKNRGSIRYNSLSNIVRRLYLLAELGYMGISFDIGRCPVSYLLAYDSLFKSVGYANVEKRVRCNPDSSEINI